MLGFIAYAQWGISQSYPFLITFLYFTWSDTIIEDKLCVKGT